MAHNKCCSIIVTHNRKKLLKRCVEYNLIQTAEPDILIIDNASTDGTSEYLSEYGLLDNSRITYKYNDKNIFGAGGFNQGLDYAFSKDYDCAWLMDDDGFPKDKESLTRILDASETLKFKEWILNSAVVGNNYSLAFGLYVMNDVLRIKKWGTERERIIYENYVNPFNGSLISREAFDKIGNIRSDFIIHGDEVEYITRAKHKGIFVGTVINSTFFHPKRRSRDYYKEDIYGRFVYCAPWMEYYETRNHICIRKWYMKESDVERYIDEVKTKIKCAPYDVKEYEYYISKGIQAGLDEDFTPLNEHPPVKYLDNADKNIADLAAEKFSWQSTLLNTWFERKDLGISIADELIERGLKTVAIYGMGVLGQHAAKELKDSKISVPYVLDKRKNVDSCGLKLHSLDDELESVDAVIVTVFQSEVGVKRILSEKFPDAEIIDIEELL